jgi:hypothetical protein
MHRKVPASLSKFLNEAISSANIFLFIAGKVAGRFFGISLLPFCDAAFAILSGREGHAGCKLAGLGRAA